MSNLQPISRSGVTGASFLKLLLAFICLMHLFITVSAAQTSTVPEPQQSFRGVLTYHNDPQRTGWNPNETILTPSNVNAQSFGLLKTVELDAAVDAQPLVVNAVDAQPLVGGQNQSKSIDSVVYVVTENNTVYGINGSTGEVLLRRNLGPYMITPQGPENCDPVDVGINSTPTIDLPSNTLYLVAATKTSAGVQQYELHALDLGTLADRSGSPITVQASATLEGAGRFSFNAAYQRQRPALLESFGDIYAAFGSFNDCFANVSRGWVLGWDMNTLSPLPMNEVTNRISSTAPIQHFLSSIWMSGYGLAADLFGDIYFVTGNSWPDTYSEWLNASESAVRLAPTLGLTVGLFTPSDVDELDSTDGDFGAGGIMVLPDQPSSSFPHLAVAAGKDGRLFVLNRDDMGGFQSTDIPNEVPIGECWCGPSYFEGPEGPQVITSGGTNLSEWSLSTANNFPSLSLVASVPSAVESTVHDPGFFTSVSSNGTKPGTAIIWAVGHGSGQSNTVTLHAFSATPSNGILPALWSSVAGVWYAGSPNPNTVPTVANGHVYVASNRELRIFGLTPPTPGNARQAHK